ncbi:hypothetical protein GCK32_013777 [Trichostrongylus colubriformis]|uniref:Uncharacterized protein n=1 Tax=Trichostrongylus colubriformis TaxID=6319 RepID=A0AAN8FXC3_TRICO
MLAHRGCLQESSLQYRFLPNKLCQSAIFNVNYAPHRLFGISDILKTNIFEAPEHPHLIPAFLIRVGPLLESLSPSSLYIEQLLRCVKLRSLDADWQILVSSTLALHTSMLVINILASVVNLMIEKYNYRKLKECTNLNKSRHEYFLAERFQVSENIRTCLMMKNVVNCVSIFNLLSTVTAGMDNFDLSITWLNGAATLFNVCVFTYGTITMSLFYYYTQPYHDFTRRILSKWRGHGTVVPRSLISTVGGAELVVSGDAQGDEYFMQLNREWNLP